MSSKWVYSETVKEHFINPRNVMENEETYHYDGKGTVGNMQCGDEMVMWIQVDKENMVITDCKWQTYGCASAIASTSILSEMVKGMPLQQAYKISPKDVTKKLEGLPENKIHCSVLGDKALRAAIDDFYLKNDMKDLVQKETARIVCQCMNVTDEEIEEAVLEGARDLIDLQEKTKLGTVCGQCIDEAEKLITIYIDKHFNS